MTDYSYPRELEDQLELVKHMRRVMIPDKYRPGHPDANRDGFLPLNASGYTTPLKQIADMTRAIAYKLFIHGAGVVDAKPGSTNNYDGITGDVIALKNGVHWDIAEDSGGKHYPAWGLVSPGDDNENYRAIAPRWKPVKTLPPIPDPKPDPDDPKKIIEELQVKILEISEERDKARLLNSELDAHISELNQKIGELNQEIERLKNEPHPCECQLSGPGWIIRAFGIKCNPRT